MRGLILRLLALVSIAIVAVCPEKSYSLARACNRRRHADAGLRMRQCRCCTPISSQGRPSLGLCHVPIGRANLESGRVDCHGDRFSL